MLNYSKLAQCLPGPLFGVHLRPTRIAGRCTDKQTYNIRCMSAVADFQAVQVELQRLCEAVAHYTSTHNAVKGTERLLKRAQRDLAFTAYFAQEERVGHSVSQTSSDCVASRAAAAQLQGARNNLRGMQAELDVAQQATDVVCLGARFYSQVSAGEGASSKRKQRTHNNANILANHFVPSGESVEVDVVAQQGLAWIEVKAHEPFDTDSSQWLGNPGHFKGLEQQAKQQLRIAKAACNQLMWQAPTVLFHFPQGVYTDVKTQLTVSQLMVK
ncbi:TPA: hypothetical protein ACH3X2_010511 [Trebouxia sp. C0005]